MEFMVSSMINAGRRLTKVNVARVRQSDNKRDLNSRCRENACLKIELFVSKSFGPCRDAERAWDEAARERQLDLIVVDIDSADGQVRAAQLGISVIPALAVND